MKRIVFSLVFVVSSIIANAQVPQGFNYQAIARDGSGNPITNQIDVKIAILSDDVSETVVWEELHAGVDPDDHGLFTIVVGKGVTQPGGLANFSLIDWTVTPLYIRTKINDVKLGIAQLWSVPYSMVSGDLGGSVKKLEVMGEDETSDEALFEVKRKDGELMFGVYNHGVRINMPLDTLSKTRKGGFVISGFDSGKDIVQDYFVVNPDSIRAYIDTNPIKTRKGGFAVAGFETGKTPAEEYLRVTRDSTRVYLNDTGTKTRKGGFAVGGFDATKQDIQDYLLVSPDSVRVFLKETDAKTRKGGFAISGYDNIKGLTNDYFNVDIDTNSTIDPSENRILWYPLKNAFLTGKVMIEKKDSVGENSFASGYESKAIGKYSQALGYQAVARKDYSTAIGYQAVANKINSFAFGQWAKAKNEESYAFGRGAIAEGFRSFAFGSAGVDSAGTVTGVAYAKGDYSFAIGQGSQALGKGAFAIGLADTAKGELSTAIGYENRALGGYSTAIGYLSTASGPISTAIGLRTTASGGISTAIGDYTTASGYNSTALGFSTIASGVAATAIGYRTTASAWYSTAIGCETIASGMYSTAMGSSTTALGAGSTAMGYHTTASHDYSTAMGYYTTASGYASTSIGYYTIASGFISTAMGVSTKASGYYSTAMGVSTNASGNSSTAMGYLTIASGNYSTSMGNETKANTFGMTAVGVNNDTTKYNGTDSYSQWYDNDPLFVIGKGAFGTRSNAVTVMKNGRVGLQTIINPTYALELPNNITEGIGQARAYAWATYSDVRTKSDRTILSYGLNEIMKLNPSEYFHHSTLSNNDGIKIQDEGRHDIGLIAQEVYNIIPEVVNKPENEDNELWSISYDKLIPVLVNGIKEQQQQIESYKSENDNLKFQLQSLQQEVEQIKALLATNGAK